MSKILNIAQTVTSILNAVLIALLVQLGCAPDPTTQKMVCSIAMFPWLSVELLGWIAAVSNVLKFVILPWLAPGGILANLFGDKTVVAPTSSPAATAGTVPPSAVR